MRDVKAGEDLDFEGTCSHEVRRSEAQGGADHPLASGRKIGVMTIVNELRVSPIEWRSVGLHCASLRRCPKLGWALEKGRLGEDGSEEHPCAELGTGQIDEGGWCHCVIR